jgi:hypothetical protein
MADQIVKELGGLLDSAVADVDGKTLGQFIPNLGSVLVQVFPADDMTKGGLHLPDASVKAIQEGKNPRSRPACQPG